MTQFQKLYNHNYCSFLFYTSKKSSSKVFLCCCQPGVTDFVLCYSYNAEFVNVIMLMSETRQRTSA